MSYITNNKNIKERAVAYARVSTEKEEQKTSIKSQMEYYPKYIEKKGMEFVKLYYDEGLSATSSNRKAFIQMLYDAGLDAKKGDGSIVTFEVNHDREPMFDWIITKDHDRFARNVNAIDIVRALRDKEVYIEFENLGFTTKDVDWEFRLSLFLTFAQQESLDKSRKLRDSYIKRAEQGKFFMSVNLFGYGRDKGSDEHYIIEDEAKVVRKIFDYYTKEGLGSSEIADKLNEQGYKTKQGRVWNGNNVLRVLKNEKYKGQVILNRYGKTDITGSNKRVINPKSEWIVHDNALPKIVSAEQFDKAQEIMKSRTKSTVKNKGSDKRQLRGKKIIRNIFYKKIFCGKCGEEYIRESATKIRAGEKVTEYFYGCRNRRNVQKNTEKCTNRGISHNVLVRELEKIAKKIGTMSYSQKRLEEEREALNIILKKLDEKLERSEKEKNKINEKIKGLDEKIANITLAIAEGVSDTVKKVMFNQIEKIEEEKNQLQSSLSQYDDIAINNEKQKYIDKFNEIVRFTKKENYNFDELLEIINRIDVLPDGTVIIDIESPTLLKDNDIYKNHDGDAIMPFVFKR